MTIPHPTTLTPNPAPDTLEAEGETAAFWDVTAGADDVEIGAEVDDRIVEEVELVADEEADKEDEVDEELPDDLEVEAVADPEAIDTAPLPTDIGVTAPSLLAAFWYHGLPHISATFPTCQPIC